MTRKEYQKEGVGKNTGDEEESKAELWEGKRTRGRERPGKGLQEAKACTDW